jgi:hypothetical protein
VAAFKFITGMKRPPPVKNRSNSKLHFEAANNIDLDQIGKPTGLEARSNAIR